MAVRHQLTITRPRGAEALAAVGRPSSLRPKPYFSNIRCFELRRDAGAAAVALTLRISTVPSDCAHGHGTRPFPPGCNLSAVAEQVLDRRRTVPSPPIDGLFPFPPRWRAGWRLRLAGRFERSCRIAPTSAFSHPGRARIGSWPSSSMGRICSALSRESRITVGPLRRAPARPRGGGPRSVFDDETEVADDPGAGCAVMDHEARAFRPWCSEARQLLQLQPDERVLRAERRKPNASAAARGGSTGLVRKSSAPAWSPRSSAPAPTSAVTSSTEERPPVRC